MNRSNGKQFIYAGFSEFGGKGLQLAGFFVLAKALDASNFGVFMSLHAAATYALSITRAGTGLWGIRAVGKKSSNNVDLSQESTVKPIIRFRLILAVLLVPVICIYAFFNEASSMFAAFLISLSLFTRSVYLDWFAKGLSRFDILAIANIAIFFLFFSGALVINEFGGALKSAAALWSICFAIGSLIIPSLLKPDLVLELRKPNRLRFFSLFRETLPLGVSGLLSSGLQNAPMIVLGLAATMESTGEFGLALRVVTGIVLGLSVIPMVMYPLLSKLGLDRSNEAIKNRIRMLSVLILLGIPTIPLVGFWGPNLMRRISDFEMIGYEFIMIILMLYAVLRGVREALFMLLAAGGKEKHYLTGLCVASLSFFFLLFIFSQIMEITTGMASALVGAEAAIVFWLFFRAGDLLRVKIVDS